MDSLAYFFQAPLNHHYHYVSDWAVCHADLASNSSYGSENAFEGSPPGDPRVAPALCYQYSPGDRGNDHRPPSLQPPLRRLWACWLTCRPLCIAAPPASITPSSHQPLIERENIGGLLPSGKRTNLDLESDRQNIHGATRSHLADDTRSTLLSPLRGRFTMRCFGAIELFKGTSTLIY